MKHLLWVGDAIATTGFARVTHNVVPRLIKNGWKVSVLGINYNGDPHKYEYDIYPAGLAGDMWGIGRFEGMVEYLRPDIALVFNDGYIIENFVKRKRDCPFLAYLPVDAINMHPDTAKALSELDRVIFYTEFGANVALASGFDGEYSIIGHGIDLELYSPMSKDKARTCMLGNRLRESDFVVGNVNRNQPRKRLDLTIAAFSDWMHSEKINNAYLYLHCAQRDIGWDLSQLSEYYGIANRIILPGGNVTSTIGLLEHGLKYVYNCFNVQLSTTLGEGWGLTHMEGMACGVPQIVPEFSALAEWPKGAVEYLPIEHYEACAGNMNGIMGCTSKQAVVDALNRLYKDTARREFLSRAGLELVRQPRFNWDSIADEFDKVFTEACGVARAGSGRLALAGSND